MSQTVISVENLSKAYRLGQIGTGTFTNDIKVWWAKAHGKPNPVLKIGEQEHGNRDGETIWALKDVSFTVEQGEVLGIIGSNGAGKSTLLKILSQVTAPTSGHVKVKGRIASLLEVGTGFHPELTGRENIYMNGAILGMTKEEVRRKYEEIVEFSGVEQFINTPVKRYSSGMYVRLAFAVAAHLEPEILVVDEVLAVGDAAFQKKCLDKMSNVAKQGRTVLFVSHNMAAMENLCSGIIVLHAGKIAFCGDVQPAISFYLDEFTEKFLLGRTNHFTKRIELVDKNGTYRDRFKIGEPMQAILYLNTVDKVLKNPIINLGIDTDLGQRVFTVGNNFSLDELPLLQGEVKISCQIEAPLLVPGKYFVKVGLRYNFDDLEEWERAISFKVEKSDIFGNGQTPREDKKQGFVAVRSQWSLIKD